MEELPESLGNDEKATVSFIGCGSSAVCDGFDRPNDKKALLSIGAVSPGRPLTFRVGAVNLTEGYWSGYDFSGASSLPTSPGTSCAQYLNTDYGFGVLLLPETDTIATQLRAEFKVPYAKLRSLKPGRLLDVKVAPGSHAPAHRDACSRDDGCNSETFKWNGEVTVRRES